jgi:hypothetical protein
MKVLVFGSLLLQTLNAQSLSDGGNKSITTLDTPAPLITPGAESDFSTSADATPAPGADFDTLDLPTGTADVIIDSSPTPSAADGVSSVDDTFGGGETPGPGIEMGDLSGFDFPAPTPAPTGTPIVGTAASETPLPETAVDVPVRNTLDVPSSSTSPDEFGLGTPVTLSEAPASPSTLVDALAAPASEFDFLPTTIDDFAEPTDVVILADAVTPSDDFAEPTDIAAPTDDLAAPTDAATPTNDVTLPEITGTENAGPGFAGAAALDAVGDGSAAPVDDGSAAPVDDEPTAPPADGSAAPIDDGSAAPIDSSTAAPKVDGSAAPNVTDDASATTPESTALPDAEPSSLDGEDVASSSTLDPESTSSVDDSLLADVTPNPDNTTDVDGSGSSAVGAADDGGNAPVSWTGGDTTHYDGEDYGYDDECPSYCMENGSEDGSDGSGDDGDYYGDGDAVIDTAPFLRRLLNRFRRRQNVPSSNGGFSALQWPGAGKKPTTSEDCKNLPNWMYEETGRTSEPCKPSCPPHCYSTSPSSTSSPESSPVDSWTRSRSAWQSSPTPSSYSASSISDYYVSKPTSSMSGYYISTPTSDASTPDGAVSTPGDNDYPYPYGSPASYDSTTTATQTTFVTSVMTSSSPYQTGSPDYTGDTLDSICPKTCNPFDPLANKCDITSSCTTTGNGKYYCACRAGFRASAWNAKDFSKQFKIPSQPYVYGAENMVCDEVCDDIYCSEVLARPQCQ